MAKQRYIAKKVGDHYEMESKRPSDELTRAGWAAAGVVLAFCGLRRRSIGGAVLAAGGGVMLYHGITGRNLVRAAMRWIPQRGDGSDHETPSYVHDFAGKSTQKPRDDVEEASMESFPASDPPGRTATTASPDSP